MINPIFYLVIIVIIYGAVRAIQGIYALYYGLQAFSWPTTEAKLLTCSLKEYCNKRSETTWEVQILYSFFFKGYTFQLGRIAFDYKSSPVYYYHEEIYNKLQSAKRIKVHYQPSNPWKAVLAPGIGYCSIFALIGCGIIIGILPPLSILLVHFYGEQYIIAILICFFLITLLALVIIKSIADADPCRYNNMLERIQVIN